MRIGSRAGDTTIIMAALTSIISIVGGVSTNKKEWLDVDRNTALTVAIHDFKANGRRYVAEFLEGESNG